MRIVAFERCLGSSYLLQGSLGSFRLEGMGHGGGSRRNGN
jgi:hypothetical protein